MRIGRIIVCLTALSCLSVCSAGPASSYVSGLRAKYDEGIRRIDSECRTYPIVCRQGYLKLLDAAMSNCQKKGDLEGYLAAQQEKGRFLLEKTVPDEAGQSATPEVADAQAKYRQWMTQAESEKSKKLLALTQQYIAQLESQKKSLTMQGKIAEAIEVKGEVDRVRTNSVVTAAEFVVADVEAKQQNEEQDKTEQEEEQEAPASNLKTLKCSRKISAGGGMTDSWTPTSTKLQPGDVLSIKASGSWKAARRSDTCGPEGYPDPRSHGSLPRLDANIPYGALIYKIGTVGAICSVGSGVAMTNEAAGLLYFDINVATDRSIRNDCSGSVTVNVEIQRSTAKPE